MQFRKECPFESGQGHHYRHCWKTTIFVHEEWGKKGTTSVWPFELNWQSGACCVESWIDSYVVQHFWGERIYCDYTI